MEFDTESERSSSEEELLLLLLLLLLELELELDEEDSLDSEEEVSERCRLDDDLVLFLTYTDFSKSCTRACERSRSAILSIFESPFRVSFEDGRFAIELNNELLAEFRARECGWSTMDAECSE